MSTTTQADPVMNGHAEDVGRKVHHDPIHKVSFSFERDGENLWVYCTMAPGAHLPEHFHPTQEERWECVEGTVRVRLDGQWDELTPRRGPAIVLPGVRHELRNDSDEVARTRTEVLPAAHLEEFLTGSAEAARQGLYNARNLPRGIKGALWLAEFAHRFRKETVMTSPPPALQRITLPPVAAIARSLGYGA